MKDLEDNRKKLIEEHIELVKIIAGTIYKSYSSYIEYDDVVSFGIIGLLDAIEKYDENKKINFKTYAQYRIRGQILDGFRKLDWVPRGVRNTHDKLNKAESKLRMELNRKPNDKELSLELGINIEELAVYKKNADLHTQTSLEHFLENSLKEVRDTTNVEEIVLKEDLKNRLAEQINSLDTRDKQLITLYYYEELTFKEIANVLNISESRVSQLHKKILENLKKHLEKLGYKH